MTLEELLALLPDNDTGAIDAADLRTIVTDLYGQIADIANVTGVVGDEITSMGAVVMTNDARITALEADSGDGSSVSVSGRWQVNPQGGANPGGKQVTASSGEFALATWLRFDPTDLNNNDMTAALMSATELFAQQQANSDNWMRCNVTGQATDSGAFVEVPIEVIGNHGSISSAQWQEVQVVLKVPA